MARLLPFRRSDQSYAPREPRLVELDDDTADAVFAALSAETARGILGRLYESPGTATDVAEAVDTSLQNARYHLEKLQSAGLVEPVDTWYSSRGTEMTVYAPTSEPLVVAAGGEEQTSVLRSAMGRLVGALGVLGLASVLVDRLARAGIAGLNPYAAEPDGTEADGGAPEMLVEEATRGAGGGAEAAAVNTTTSTPTPAETVAAEATGAPTAAATQTPAPTPTPAPSPTTTPSPAAMGDAGLVDLGGALPPGALFFLGGLVVLAAIATWWYRRRYRPLYG